MHQGGDILQKNKLKAKMVEKDITVALLAKKIGINPTTFYRKCNTNYFTLQEMTTIAELLDLHNEDLLDIFFEKKGA